MIAPRTLPNPLAASMEDLSPVDLAPLEFRRRLPDHAFAAAVTRRFRSPDQLCPCARPSSMA